MTQTSTALYPTSDKLFVSFEPVPEEPICTCTPEFEDPDCHLRIEEYSRWKSALVEVEDQEKVKNELLSRAFHDVQSKSVTHQKDLSMVSDPIEIHIQLKPDTIIPFVASWEVVEQWCNIHLKEWYDGVAPLDYEIESRKIARLVNQ